MWTDILLSIAMSIGDAIVGDMIDSKKKSSQKRRIHDLCTKTLYEFADTSLDCKDFYDAVNSITFTKLIRIYFFYPEDGIDNMMYLDKMTAMLLSRCKTCNEIDVRRFINKLISSVIENLQKDISEDFVTRSLYMLITLSNRTTYRKLWIQRKASKSSLGLQKLEYSHAPMQSLMSFIIT